jgi:integrase
MSVHQLKDGRWIVKIYDPEKKSKFRWEYFGRGSVAESKARARDNDLDFKKTKPKNDNDESPFFHDLVGDYILHHNFNPNSEKLCKIRFYSIIIPVLGQVKAMRLSHDDIDRYIRERHKTVKMNTIRRELTDIKSVMNWAVKRRPPMIPLNNIRDYQLPPSNDAVIQPPTMVETDAILKHANERLFRAIKIAWYTGLRPGAVELFSLRWDHVLFETRTIQITSADKGGPKRREVPIHPEFLSELEAWKVKDGDPSGYIIHQNGRQILRLITAWRIAKKKAGITRRLRMYDLRHFFVTTAIESGADYKTLSEIVGSSPETLRKHYQHVSGAARVSLIGNMPSQDRVQKPVTTHGNS